MASNWENGELSMACWAASRICWAFGEGVGAGAVEVDVVGAGVVTVVETVVDVVDVRVGREG